MAAILPLCCQPPSTSALKFNFTAFTGGDTNITYEEAFPADNAIQLTRNLLGSTLNSSVGRATYNSPLPLWDPISRNLTDFQTHFVFSIFSQFKDGYGDGFAFFLAPFNSKLPPATPGGTLGLTDGPHALNTTANHFVAVEFDIFSNDFDPLPLGRHLGIDEFLPNGSLDSHLFQKMKESSLLNWETRYKIAKGLASGLLYLHEEWEQCVVHRDIKSSNIMLDSNFNAKLGDFGLARLVDHDKGSQTTLLAGTMGYLAPECVVTGKASRESDVFSFGVVLLEIATGRRPAVKVEGDGKLVEWVWELYGDGRLTMMEGGPDRRLDGEYDVEEMERLLMVGLCCAHPDSSSRPSVRQAVQLLNFEAPVPVLPVNMPVASYGGGDQMREGSFGVSTSTMMTMADADLQRRHVSCDFDGSNGVATSPLGKNGSNNAVTF
ncbi:L-type lectin-domain containing receptor kinase IX.1 [Linum grandiflorum]